MKKIILAFLCSLGTIISVNAQNDALLKAYAASLDYEKAGDYKGAIKIMTPFYDSSNYELNLKMGYLNYYSGNYKEATKYYKKSIKKIPDAVEPRMGYVYASSMLANWGEVKEQYKAILKIDPNNSFVNYNLGLIFYNNKEYKTAYKHFEKVCRLYPFDYANMLMFAWTNIQLHQNTEAKIWFHKVLMLSPYDKSAMEGLALLSK